MKQTFYTCKVQRILDEAPLVKRYFVRFPDEVDLNFHAGQFVMLNLPIQSKYTHRSYSIASAPDKSNVIELLIVLKPDGAGTPHLFSKVNVNDVVECSLPLGKFRLPEVLDQPLFFICTGTGIAPFRSMIQHIVQNQVPHKGIHLIFGTRTEADLLYRQEFEVLAKSDEKFFYKPVLSREQNPEWKGRKGYVHQVYEEIIKQNIKGYFYLCGWSAMIREARENLIDLGIDKSMIKFELYD
jgi:NAD(P)H-flavin reductase